MELPSRDGAQLAVHNRACHTPLVAIAEITIILAPSHGYEVTATIGKIGTCRFEKKRHQDHNHGNFAVHLRVLLSVSQQLYLFAMQFLSSVGLFRWEVVSEYVFFFVFFFGGGTFTRHCRWNCKDFDSHSVGKKVSVHKFLHLHTTWRPDSAQKVLPVWWFPLAAITQSYDHIRKKSQDVWNMALQYRTWYDKNVACKEKKMWSLAEILVLINK